VAADTLLKLWRERSPGMELGGATTGALTPASRNVGDSGCRGPALNCTFMVAAVVSVLSDVRRDDCPPPFTCFVWKHKQICLYFEVHFVHEGSNLN
jgi:hypothetical protein